MSPNLDLLVQVASQIPIVAVFVWFVLQMYDRFQKSQMLRDAEWREFLSAEAKKNIEAYNRVAVELISLGDKLKLLGEQLKLQSEVLLNHDKKVDQLSSDVHIFIASQGRKKPPPSSRR
jgi:hypothetical protein